MKILFMLCFCVDTGFGTQFHNFHAGMSSELYFAAATGDYETKSPHCRRERRGTGKLDRTSGQGLGRHCLVQFMCLLVC